MNYSFHDKIIVRTPLYPIRTAFSIEELKKLYQQQAVQEALFLASPNLYEECQKWLHDQLDTVEKDKTSISLLKYAYRLHTRSTPFGLFAKCSIAQWGKETNLTVDAKNLFRRTKLDMNFSCQLAQSFSKSDLIQKHLQFYPNNSLYKVHDKIRYVEYYYKNEERVYRISSIDDSIYIQKIIEASNSGATIHELAQTIVDMDDEVSLEEASEFINQLIIEQILVSEMEPSVSGKEQINEFLSIMKGIFQKTQSEVLGNNIHFFEGIQSKLNDIDNQLFNPVESYKNLAINLDQLSIPYQLGKLFQTDLFEKSTSNKDLLSYSIKRSLIKALRIINKITPNYSGRKNLVDFASRFYERYQDEEVALLTVLDNEAGIGYASNTNKTGDVSPLVNELNIPHKLEDSRDITWRRIDSFLMKKITEANKQQKKVITIDNHELKHFDEDWSNLADSISTLFSKLPNDKILLKTTGGSSAVSLLGRFGSGHPDIKDIIKEVAEYEQQLNPNQILAEIVHLPKARTGNILMRPSIRNYEIPYLSKSNLPLDQQISLDDLYVSIDRNQRIKLRSKRLNKEVLPRLANAHNYHFKSLPVYHFLCDLQNQNLRGGIYFDWGNLDSEFSFFPRVEIGNVIVSPATWKLKRNEFDELLKKDIDVQQTIQKWQSKWALPNLVLLAEGDNELLINLQDHWSVQVLLKSIKKRPIITFKEFIFDGQTGIHAEEKPNQSYANECIAIILKDSLKKNNVISTTAIQDKIPITNVQRNFSLGSEWLFYKIFTGIKTADELLKTIIKPLTESWLAKGLIKKWFFIRYSNPDVHLRIRFQLTAPKQIGTLITEFHEAISDYVDTKLIWKIQTDVYQRELERYGYQTIELAEEIFYQDSVNVLTVLDSLEESEIGEKYKWLYALRSIDALLDGFQYNLESKKNIVSSLREGFGQEFNMNKYLNKQLDKKYRESKTEIYQLLDSSNDSTSELHPLLNHLAQKSERINPIIKKILPYYLDSENGLALNQLVASYSHMFVNRLFKNKQRLHELVLYDFLRKKYTSDFYRNRKAK